MQIFGDASQLTEDVHSAADPLGGLRFHRAAAVEASDTIQAIGPTRSLAPDAVTLLSYDYKALADNAASDCADIHHAIAPALWQQASAVGYAQHFEAVAHELPWRPALEDDHGLRLKLIRPSLDGGNVPRATECVNN